jgi:hypothetical protein
LPKVSCSLTFYTNDDIENDILIKTPRITVKIDDSQHNVEIPFIIKKDFFDKMVLIKHDSAILYMEVNEEK